MALNVIRIRDGIPCIPYGGVFMNSSEKKVPSVALDAISQCGRVVVVGSEGGERKCPSVFVLRRV